LAKNLQKNSTELLGAMSAFLHSRFQGRPHPLLLHRSADATFALMRSLWLDGQNLADYGAELEEKVEKASDAGGLPDLLMKASVDESWVSQLQSSAVGLPWLPDIPASSAMFDGATQEELWQLAAQLAEGEPLGAEEDLVLSPFAVLSAAAHDEDGKVHWETTPMASHWYFGPLVAKLSALLAKPPFDGLGGTRLGEAIVEGRATSICSAAVERALSIARGRARHHAWLSLCPISGDVRDLWKWPFSLVAGIASRLSPQVQKGAQRTRTHLQNIWQDAIARGFPHAARNLHAAGMLRNDTERPIIAVWPIRYGGAPGTMMQDPHLLHLWGGHGRQTETSFGSAWASLLVMDVVNLKCQGQWARVAQALGGPKVLTTASCIQSVAAVHTAIAEAPPALLLVGRADVSVQVDDASFLASMSKAWRDLALQAPAAASPQPVAMAAFGSWWPAVRLLWAEAGALIACEFASGTESCLWAAIARSAAELRPWEDFVGSDSVPLMSATMLLAWLAKEQVIYCEDWEDEQTGKPSCACGPPVPADGSSSDILNGRLMPAAPKAARDLLQVLAEIILAGDPANAQRFYTVVMANEDWQVLYGCVSQVADPQRYLILDRGNLELPEEAQDCGYGYRFVGHLRHANFNSEADTLEPLPADELFNSVDRSSFAVSGGAKELKTANGDQSLVIREEEEGTSFVESAAGQISEALETFDGAVSQGLSAPDRIYVVLAEEAQPAPKRVD
ncbi:unnamed protein product, partial [Symbiodinium natans]